MTAQHLAADEPFFSQWMSRGVLPRSLGSSIALMEALDFVPPRSVGVVGSKGKGTTAAALSMTTSAAGLRTVSVTSPAFRSNRERIRIDGKAISQRDYETVSARLSSVLDSLPTDHYLSPSGAFTIMGAWWASQVGADLLVVEEGMGGVTDEVSLFDHVALAVTPIFMEHEGILGNTLPEIARNLIGAGSPSVRYLASAQQVEAVETLVDEYLDRWDARRLCPTPTDHVNAFVAENIGLGHALGVELVKHVQPGHNQKLNAPAVPELNLPGRSSFHETPTGRWFIDAAISPAGVREALRATEMQGTTVVVSWPESKDAEGCLALVPGAIHVRAGTGLDYQAGLPSFADVKDSLLGDVIALGTISFVAEALEHVGAQTGLW